MTHLFCRTKMCVGHGKASSGSTNPNQGSRLEQSLRHMKGLNKILDRSRES